MTEKFFINGRNVWVVVEPLTVPENADTVQPEFFIASYSFEEPVSGAGEMLRDGDNRPKLFASPVEALEYANEKLLEII